MKSIFTFRFYSFFSFQRIFICIFLKSGAILIDFLELFGISGNFIRFFVAFLSGTRLLAAQRRSRARSRTGHRPGGAVRWAPRGSRAPSPSLAVRALPPPFPTEFSPPFPLPRAPSSLSALGRHCHLSPELSPSIRHRR